MNQNQNSRLLKYGCAILCLAWAVIAVMLCLYVSDYDRAFLFDKGRIFYTVEEINVHFVQCLRVYPQALLYPDRRFFTLFAFPFEKLFGRAGVPPMLSMRLLNAILSVFVLYLFMSIARKLKFSAHAVLLSGILLILHPLFVFLCISTLPDITFVFFLLVSLYFLLDKKNAAAALFVSVLPFIRFDGIFVIALFFLIFAAGGKLRQSLPMMIPLALYVIADTLIYHDPLRAYHFFRAQYHFIYTYTPRAVLPQNLASESFRFAILILNPGLVLLSVPTLLQRGLKKQLPEGFVFLLAAFILGFAVINHVERIPHGRMLLPLLIIMMFFSAAAIEMVFSGRHTTALKKLYIAAFFILALVFSMRTFQNGYPESAFRTPHVSNPQRYKAAYDYLMGKNILKKNAFDFVFIDFYSIPEIILLDDACNFHETKHYYNGFLLDAPLMEMKSFYYDAQIRIAHALPQGNGLIITKRKPALMEKLPGAHLLKAFENEKMYVYSCCQP